MMAADGGGASRSESVRGESKDRFEVRIKSYHAVASWTWAAGEAGR